MDQLEKDGCSNHDIVEHDNQVQYAGIDIFCDRKNVTGTKRQDNQVFRTAEQT